MDTQDKLKEPQFSHLGLSSGRSRRSRVLPEVTSSSNCSHVLRDDRIKRLRLEKRQRREDLSGTRKPRARLGLGWRNSHSWEQLTVAAAALVQGGLSSSRLPPALGQHVLPHLRLLKNIQPAACLRWCSRPSPSPAFGPIQEEGQGTFRNGKLQNSGLWEKGQWEKAGLWDGERREKGDDRVRGDS